jgi:hypothetical protein
LVARVDTPDSVVALTFDDGPVPALTDSLVAVLRARGVRATFFVTGRELAAAPAAAGPWSRPGTSSATTPTRTGGWCSRRRPPSGVRSSGRTP